MLLLRRAARDELLAALGGLSDRGLPPAVQRRLKTVHWSCLLAKPTSLRCRVTWHRQKYTCANDYMTGHWIDVHAAAERRTDTRRR